MPLSQAHPDALAHTYARSLLELANAEGGQEAVERTLGELEEILELSRSEASFGEFLASRVLSAKARSSSLGSIFEGRASDLTLRLTEAGEWARGPALPPVSEEGAPE